MNEEVQSTKTFDSLSEHYLISVLFAVSQDNIKQGFPYEEQSEKILSLRA